MFGKETVLATNGPMMTDRESLELFMQVVLAAEPWRLEPSIRVQPWAPYQFKKPIKVAVQWWDGVVSPHPPMLRALREVSEACKRAGMKVVDWDSEALNHQKGWEILSGLYYPDGGREVLGRIKDAGEPVLPLTNFIIEQPNVKYRSMEELWKVSRVLSRPHICCKFTDLNSYARRGKHIEPPTPVIGPELVRKMAKKSMLSFVHRPLVRPRRMSNRDTGDMGLSGTCLTTPVRFSPLLLLIRNWTKRIWLIGQRMLMTSLSMTCMSQKGLKTLQLVCRLLDVDIWMRKF